VERTLEELPLARSRRISRLRAVLLEASDLLSKTLLDLEGELRKQLIKGHTE